MLTTRIHEYRKKYNMQQSQLADLVGVRRETIGKLEDGKYNPSLKLAMDIAHVFHTTVEEMFIFTPDITKGEEHDPLDQLPEN